MKKKMILLLIVCLLIAAVYAATDVIETNIKDGTGTVNKAKINVNNQLVVKSLQTTPFREAVARGDAYSWTAVTADLHATDTALLVANDSQTRELVIEKIYAWSDVATEVDIHLPATGTWAGTAVTGVNLNKLSANTADATADANETGNTQANLIATLHTNELTTDQFGIDYDLGGSVVLGYGDAIAVDLVSDSAAFDCSIVGYFRDKE